MSDSTRYTQLCIHERAQIEIRLRDGYSPTAIATEMGRPHSTVLRELRRNGGGLRYRADQPQGQARRRRACAAFLRGRHLDRHGAMAEGIVTRMEDCRSVRQALHLLTPAEVGDAQVPSHETVYAWMYGEDGTLGTGVGDGSAGLRERARRALVRPRRHRRNRKRSAEKRGKIKNMGPIAERPDDVAGRDVFGHWEGDLVVGAGGRSAVATLVERKTRYTIVLHLANKMAEVVCRALRRLMRSFPVGTFASLTWDQGKELAGYEALTRTTGVPIFFAGAHSPWQRGTNENTNGVLRRKIPRGSDLSTIGKARAAELSAWLNSRPMPVLSWASPENALRRRAPRTSCLTTAWEILWWNPAGNPAEN